MRRPHGFQFLDRSSLNDGYATMSKSKLDSIYRYFLVNHFFERGWGKPDNLKRLFEFRKIISNRQTCFPLIPQDFPVNITKRETLSDCTILEGNFITPFELHLPGIVPKAAQQAHFQVVLPKKWKDEQFKPMCIHLAGTGDHFFWRRRNFIAKPLLKEANIGSILLENPFYGLRKPDDQVRSNLKNVSDIFVMGGCLILECLVLLHWCERHGLGPLGITGLSMGGHMASLAACNWPKPLVLVPCLSWSTASAVFTTGVLSQSINWDVLETQYHSDGYYHERLSKMVTVVDDAFMAGKNFMKNVNNSLNALKTDINATSSERDPKSMANESSIFLESGMQNRILTEGTFKREQIDIGKIPDSSMELNKVRKVQSELEVVPSGPTPSTLTKLMGMILPQSAQKNELKLEKLDITKTNWWEREALQFMRGMMDECTHLRNFSVPYDTSLIIVVCAKEDAYVPREGCSSLEDIWPGAEVRYLDAGHVSAYVLHQKLFRSCIIEAFERAKKLHEKEGCNGENLQSPLTYEQLLKKYANTC